MTDISKKDKDFKEAIGGFIIAFSKLEFGLAFLCSMTDFDLRQKDTNLVKCIGFSFEQKMKQLTDFINEHMEEIKPVWDKLKEEIGQLNRERRFLAHGFMTYYLPHETITTHIKERGQIVTKNQTLQEINSLTNRLHHVSSGESGINGTFHILFMKTRINEWNNLVNDEAKMVYKVDDVIVSDWKGKANA
jgi:hypothetical protein